jgi:hypothetical protein
MAVSPPLTPRWPKNSFQFKRKFTTYEDSVILDMMSESPPPDWDAIASHLRGRTARQCRERWRHYLDPIIKNTAWTDEEDEILTREHQRIGARWAAIALYLPGRTEVNIKNRWCQLMRQANRSVVTRDPGDETAIPGYNAFSSCAYTAELIREPKTPTVKFPSLREICPELRPGLLPLPRNADSQDRAFIFQCK